MPRTHSSDLASRMLGGEVRQARRAAQLTQAQLAERLRVSPARVAAIETGRANPTIGALAELANALGTGLDVRFPPVAAEYERLEGSD